MSSSENPGTSFWNALNFLHNVRTDLEINELVRDFPFLSEEDTKFIKNSSEFESREAASLLHGMSAEASLSMSN